MKRVNNFDLIGNLYNSMRDTRYSSKYTNSIGVIYNVSHSDHINNQLSFRTDR